MVVPKGVLDLCTRVSAVKANPATELAALVASQRVDDGVNRVARSSAERRLLRDLRATDRHRNGKPFPR